MSTKSSVSRPSTGASSTRSSEAASELSGSMSGERSATGQRDGLTTEDTFTRKTLMFTGKVQLSFVHISGDLRLHLD